LGAAVKGLRVSFQGPDSVRAGGKVPVTVVLENVSRRDVRVALKSRFDTECGLTTLVDGPNGCVPYKWQLDPELGICQATMPVWDWSQSKLPIELRPGDTYKLSFDLSEVFDLSAPGRYDIVVLYPLPDLGPGTYFDPIEVRDYATSNKITVTVR
jgi:hypothetical protein